MKPWDAEISVDCELATRLIRDQFPDLVPFSLTELSSGWDNKAMRLSTADGEFAFRFPRRQIAVELIETECRVLPAIADRLSLAIPAALFEGSPTAEYRWPFAGAEYIPGETACRVHPDHRAREGMAPALGKFLRELHAIPTVNINAPRDIYHRMDREKRTPQIHTRLQLLSERNQAIRPADYQSLIDAAENARAVRNDCLVHGDLYARHLLVAEDNLSGIIDWGDMHIGDPACDLSIAFGFLPPSAHADFFATYGGVDEDTIALAKWRMLVHTLTVEEYANDTEDADLLRECAIALAQLRDV